MRKENKHGFMLYYYYNHVIIYCVLTGFIVVRFKGLTIFCYALKYILKTAKAANKRVKL